MKFPALLPPFNMSSMNDKAEMNEEQRNAGVDSVMTVEGAEEVTLFEVPQHSAVGKRSTEKKDHESDPNCRPQSHHSQGKAA